MMYHHGGNFYQGTLCKSQAHPDPETWVQDLALLIVSYVPGYVVQFVRSMELCSGFAAVRCQVFVPVSTQSLL